MVVKCNDISELAGVTEVIYKHSHNSTIWLLEAEMGVGKTTFVKTLGNFLNITDHISSPTYNIVNEYITADNSTIYHFDFYRIQSEEEAYQVGIEEYLDSGNLCLIEWGKNIESILNNYPQKFTVNIELNNHCRIFTF